MGNPNVGASRWMESPFDSLILVGSCRWVAGWRASVGDTFRRLSGTSRNMSTRAVLPKIRTMIPSSFVIRALAHHGKRFECKNCGEQMFVQYESGLCPLCFNGRRAVDYPRARREVPASLVLAGVLDDPLLEDLEPGA
jgi:hypothetical protein